MPYTRHDTLLAIENVSYAVDDKQILHDVNATIQDIVRPGYTTGQIVAFLGPSGCGKSTLLRIIAGLATPTTGSVLLGPARTPVQRGMVGLVTQTYNLFRNRTVLGNLLIAAKQNKKSREHPDATKWRCVEILKKLSSPSSDLLALQDRYPSQLSGGQRQRVAICRQLLCSDHLLLMDEPFSGLDIVSKLAVTELIHSVANTDELNSIVLVTHNIRDALAIADTVWIMSRGTIVRAIDLIDCGLCWAPNVCELQKFAEMQKEIEEMFKTL